MTVARKAGQRLASYTLHDLPGVYRVCADVGARGEKSAQQLDTPDLAGHVFAGPFLAHDPGLSWVVSDDQGVAGYIVGTADTEAFERWREEHWYPALRGRHPLPAGTSVSETDARYLRFLHAPPRGRLGGLENHPASLHIKISPRAAGRGWGRLLVLSLVDELARRGVNGLHLDVAASNQPAIAFYDRLGFRELCRDGDTYTLIRESR